jgi:hypothetical protein
MVRWIAVSKRLPLDRQDVLFSNGNYVYFGTFRKFSSGHTEWMLPDCDCTLIDNVTHWSLLPPLPRNS